MVLQYRVHTDLLPETHTPSELAPSTSSWRGGHGRRWHKCLLGAAFNCLRRVPRTRPSPDRASGVVRERSRRVRGVHCARTPRNQNTICGRNSSPLKIQHTIRAPTRRRRPLQRHFFNAMPSPPSKRNRASGSDDDTATADGAGPAAEAAATGDGGSAQLEPIIRDRSHDVRHKWSCFKSQAARRDIAQRLTFEQFSTLVQMPCAYCGGGANEQNAAFVGIDRINSAVRMYGLTNCVPCCATCNFMKGSLVAAVFLAKIRAIAAWRTGVQF
jgi:hypothetical protein